MLFIPICKNCHKLFFNNNQFCSRACATAYSSRFHNNGIFIHNEYEWVKYKKQYYNNIKKEYPTNLSSLNDYFSGYYMDIHHEVRSGSEHNICRILQLLQIDYDYEFYTFKLNNKTYRPDFYIVNEDTFYEMKGEWRGDSQEKLELFQQLYPSIKLILINMPTYLQIEHYASTLFHINFNQHIKIKDILIQNTPQYRSNINTYSFNELNYKYYTNKLKYDELINPVTVTDYLNNLLQEYRNNGKIYYAIYKNQYWYNKKDIDIFKNELKNKVKIVIPKIIKNRKC